MARTFFTRRPSMDASADARFPGPMHRFALLLLAVVFLISGFAVVALNQAGAQSAMGEMPYTQLDAIERIVERCVLQPVRVRHPDHGAFILVLRPTC